MRIFRPLLTETGSQKRIFENEVLDLTVELTRINTLLSSLRQRGCLAFNKGSNGFNVKLLYFSNTADSLVFSFLVVCTFFWEPFRKVSLVCKQYFSYFVCVSYSSCEISQGSHVGRFHDNNNNNNSRSLLNLWNIVRFIIVPDYLSTVSRIKLSPLFKQRS
jgi:hypothetical protein